MGYVNLETASENAGYDVFYDQYYYVRPIQGVCRQMIVEKKLPIGIEDFEKMRTDWFYDIEKSVVRWY